MKTYFKSDIKQSERSVSTSSNHLIPVISLQPALFWEERKGKDPLMTLIPSYIIHWVLRIKPLISLIPHLSLWHTISWSPIHPGSDLKYGLYHFLLNRNSLLMLLLYDLQRMVRTQVNDVRNLVSSSSGLWAGRSSLLNMVVDRWPKWWPVKYLVAVTWLTTFSRYSVASRPKSHFVMSLTKNSYIHI